MSCNESLTLPKSLVCVRSVTLQKKAPQNEARLERVRYVETIGNTKEFAANAVSHLNRTSTCLL